MKQSLLNYKQRKPCVSSWSVLLIIGCDTLMYAHINLIRYFPATLYIVSHVDHKKGHSIFFNVEYIFLLVDVKSGRYNVIITCVHFPFISWIFGGLSVIVKSYSDLDVLYLILLG